MTQEASSEGIHPHGRGGSVYLQEGHSLTHSLLGEPDNLVELPIFHRKVTRRIWSGCKLSRGVIYSATTRLRGEVIAGDVIE